MTDYSNTFGGAAKDAADATANATDLDVEFDAIATMSATKANKTGAPATTNNLAMLDANGDLADSLVETDGSGNITANVTGNLTGNVTGNLTGNVVSSQTVDITIDKANPTLLLDASSGAPALKLLNSSTLRSNIFWNSGDDSLYIQQLDTDGSTVRARISLSELGVINIDTGSFKVAGVDATPRRILLDTQVVSGASTVNFEDGTGDIAIDGTYKYFEIELDEVLPGTATDTLRLRFSSTGGSPYISTGYLDQDANTTFIGISGALHNASGYGASGLIRVFDCSSTNINPVHGTVVGQSNATTLSYKESYGTLNNTTAMNAFQIFASTGTISGTFRLFGIL